MQFSCDPWVPWVSHRRAIASHMSWLRWTPHWRLPHRSTSLSFQAKDSQDRCATICVPRVPWRLSYEAIARSDGRVPLSQEGSGKVGTHVGPVSALIRLASTYPIEGPRGQPHPMRNTSGPAAARIVCRASVMASAREILKSYFPFPFKQATYRKSIFKTVKPQSTDSASNTAVDILSHVRICDV